ncbi:MAG: glucose-6-phosphate isomerase [Culturomica sp.]|jgi:glucose-6-phosphate isomerase|nr:glucose-6-phosphate isomerase [Culturomica sp.]
MKKIEFSPKQVNGFVSDNDIKSLYPEAKKAFQSLKNGTSKGNDFLGWLRLPSEITDEFLSDIENTAKELSKRVNVIVVIGIGGSYLGARAVIEALSDSFSSYDNEGMKIIYAGHNIGEDYYHEMMNYLNNKEFGICVISKSGTTTEPAIAFRLLKEMLEQKVGKAEAGKRIVAITDEKKGALRTLALQEGYKTYVIPDNIGGRFSVLTPVGLLPIALAGFNIKKFIAGAAFMQNDCMNNEENIALEYASTRSALYAKGYIIELLANFNPKLHFITEWWKQLYGESEGKENKGIFPAGVDFTTDLHSMGQYIQQGPRMLMETVISVDKQKYEVKIPTDSANLDQLNFLAGKRIDEVNKMAELGTRIAHVDGGVPNMEIVLPELNEETIGQLIYFFELACGISGSMLGVNPFDQPGVEDYKNNMFALLNKPGYEEKSRKIKERVDNVK